MTAWALPIKQGITIIIILIIAVCCSYCYFLEPKVSQVAEVRMCSMNINEMYEHIKTSQTLPLLKILVRAAFLLDL